MINCSWGLGTTPYLLDLMHGQNPCQFEKYCTHSIYDELDLHHSEVLQLFVIWGKSPSVIEGIFETLRGTFRSEEFSQRSSEEADKLISETHHYFFFFPCLISLLRNVAAAEAFFAAGVSLISCKKPCILTSLV